MKKANPFKRTIADLIDGVILISVKLVIAGCFINISVILTKMDRIGFILNISLWVFYLISITLIFFGYYIYFFTKYSATPGKMLFNLKVVDDKTGRNITKKQAFLRAVGYLIGGFALYLGIIWILFDKKDQGWHDKIASTRMIDLIK
ncbi:MAG: RDD family protein [Spirochaetes bacterium]|nr:RDD family protein [Spirochaetota bacterium]